MGGAGPTKCSTTKHQKTSEQPESSACKKNAPVLNQSRKGIGPDMRLIRFVLCYFLSLVSLPHPVRHRRRVVTPV